LRDLCRGRVNPLRKKYSTLPKFGIGVCVAHPGSSLRGDLVVVTFASPACGGRGSVFGCERPRAGRIALREPKTSCRRAALLGSSRHQVGGNVHNAVETSGEMASRACGNRVVLASREFLRSGKTRKTSFDEGASGCSRSRPATGGTRRDLLGPSFTACAAEGAVL